uniref:Ig-like domain-containing protein n=1 Tax=Chelonoidis abingdonii TaxID=106734 RepID=A0A8C0HB69_CHEAB
TSPALSCLPLCLLLSAEMYPKPTISLSPSRVIALGQDVTIWCQAGRRDARFSLFKVGDWTLPGHVEPAGAGGEFLIHSMRQGDRGSYYHYATDPFAWSEPSDPEELLVADTPNLPSPCAPVGGSPWGGAVTVRCRGRHQNARFLLYKDGNPIVLQDVEPAGDVADTKSDSPVWSEPSDPRELVVAGEGPGSVSPFPAHTQPDPRGANVTIWCQGPRRDMRFFLHKAGDLNLQRQMDPAGDVAEFLIPTVGQQHRGSYSCSYRPQSEPFVSSQPSDTVQLVVAGEELGSASLFPSPHPVRSLGVSALMGRSEPAPMDFTNTNIARLVLCAGVFLVLGLILAEAYYSRPRGTP